MQRCRDGRPASQPSPLHEMDIGAVQATLLAAARGATSKNRGEHGFGRRTERRPPGRRNEVLQCHAALPTRSIRSSAGLHANFNEGHVLKGLGKPSNRSSHVVTMNLHHEVNVAEIAGITSEAPGCVRDRVNAQRVLPFAARMFAEAVENSPVALEANGTSHVCNRDFFANPFCIGHYAS